MGGGRKQEVSKRRCWKEQRIQQIPMVRGASVKETSYLDLEGAGVGVQGNLETEWECLGLLLPSPFNIPSDLLNRKS